MHITRSLRRRRAVWADSQDNFPDTGPGLEISQCVRCFIEVHHFAHLRGFGRYRQQLGQFAVEFVNSVGQEDQIESENPNISELGLVVIVSGGGTIVATVEQGGTGRSSLTVTLVPLDRTSVS